MVYEFKGLDIPEHKCNVLDTRKVSATRTHLICVICKQIIGMWDDERPEKEYPKDSQYYTEATLENLR